jgi:SpoVK/Ycf46/Vps4 family AAA+-type ATPase
MLQTLRTVLNTLSIYLVSYLWPSSEISIKMAISMFIVEILESLVVKFSEYNTSFRFGKLNNVKIQPGSDIYVLFNKHISTLRSQTDTINYFASICDKNTIFNENLTLDTYGLAKVQDKYENQQISIQYEKRLESFKRDGSTIEEQQIVIVVSSKLQHKKIIEYIQTNAFKYNITRTTQPVYYYFNSKIKQETRLIEVKKTLATMALSKDVKINFLDDLDMFFKNEEVYNQKELTWKRGYLLYGPPGTGKTSLVRYASTKYNINISNIVKKNVVYFGDTWYYNNMIVLVEDFNKKMFQPDKESEHNDTIKSGSFQDFLNIMDGILPLKRTIFIITTNDETIFTNPELKPLFRPGRIDKIIKVDYCDVAQVNQLLKIYGTLDFPQVKELKVKIAPSQIMSLSQLVQMDEIQYFVDYLEQKNNKFLELIDINTCCRNVIRY